MLSLLKSIRGVIVLLLVALNLLFIGGSVIITSIFSYLIFIPKWHRWFRKNIVMQIPVLWSMLNSAAIAISNYGKITIKGPNVKDMNGFYLLISNHQSWADIFLIGKAFDLSLPPAKFFLKRELLWTLPIGGWVCWCLGFPFLRRHTKEQVRKRPELKNIDLETTKKACNDLGKYPGTLINFVEGTRFTQDKKERQRSPYNNLLKPKAAGISICCNELRSKINNMVNVTIKYADNNSSMWSILKGDVKQITIEYSLIPITEDFYGDYYKDRDYRRRFQRILNDIWQAKDARLDEL